MQVLARLAIVVLVLLASVDSAAKPSEADFEGAGQQLQQCARDLRDVAEAMRAHAKTTIPEGLNKEEKRTLASQRRELTKAAGGALKLADQCADRERKALRRTLTRADMKSLAVEIDRLAGRVPTTRSPAPKRMSSAALNQTIREVEGMQEALRNKRQQAVTAFHNFDWKWNQQFNMLTTVLENKKYMNAGVARNML